jgi:excisionase family DNA binding protein
MEELTTLRRMAWGLGEVAEFTGLSLAFLRNEVRAGRLPVRRFGRRVLVRDEDLKTYLEKGSDGNHRQNTQEDSIRHHQKTETSS